MDFAHEPIFQWLAQYAYQPNLVYVFVFLMMLASGFGLPLPEEITIVSVGVLAYMGANPDLFPPPFTGAPVVNGYHAAIVTLISVIFADFLVFSIGRIFGRKLMSYPRFKKLFSESLMNKVNHFVKKFGVLAAFIFRFTPGIRFPAHIVLGMSHFAAWQFVLVDSLAAAISVPSQILLIYHYGDSILKVLYEFKIWFFSLLACLLIFLLLKRGYQRWRQ